MIDKWAKRFGVAAFGAFVLAGVLTAGGCEESDPAPDSDSSYNYADGSKIPVDEKVYTVSGEVTGQVNSATRQVEPAKGSLSAYNGYASGTFTGPIEAGKGFVRLKITGSDSNLAPMNELVILKTADTKVSALLSGDVVTFKCRAQYENIAAVKDGQKFEERQVATYELDYCRLETPTVQVR